MKIITSNNNQLLKQKYQKHYYKYENAEASVLYFFFGSFLGWLWEVFLTWFRDGMFVNRGVLHGPWLPIYGFGCILMLLLKKWLGKKPLWFCFASIVAGGILEYTTSWFLETIFHARWWDYSNELININGRICIITLVLFSAAGSMIVFLVVPWLHKKLALTSYKIKRITCTILILLFVFDFLYSFCFPNFGPGISTMI